MGLHVGNMPVRAVYVGSTPVREVYVGSELIWPTAVQITLGAGYEAQSQLRAALSARGLDYQTVEEIPFDIELVGTGSARSMFNGYSSLTTTPPMNTANVTHMDYMFYGCSSLTHVPDMDTSQVTDMGFMFRGCSSLTHVPDMDTSNVTGMDQMFRDCAALTHVPDMDTSSVMTMRYMFYNCASLTDGNVRLIGRHPDVDTAGMINNSGLTRLPFYDTDGSPI